MNTQSKLSEITLRFLHKYKLPPELINDILELININEDINQDKQIINYGFANNEYGEMAEKWYKENNFKLNRAYSGDAGFDLPVFLSHDEQKHGKKMIWANEREMLHTGLIIEFPVGYYGRIIHRSSTEKIHRLRVIEGIIDDYRGEMLVQVHNQYRSNIEVYHGTKIAQLILCKTHPFNIDYKDAKSLRPSDRGAKGFGSSGK